MAPGDSGVATALDGGNVAVTATVHAIVHALATMVEVVKKARRRPRWRRIRRTVVVRRERCVYAGTEGIHGSVTSRWQARSVSAWAAGEVLGLDFETTGVDRFRAVPVSYALVSVVEGVVVRSWSGLVDPGCEIPADATAVHGISTTRARREGMPLQHAIGLVVDAVLAAARRGVPLAGMRLDYDLTILDGLSRQLGGLGLVERGWRGPVLDAGVLDRHLDPVREGRRTLSDLCRHYGIELARPHDAAADAIASIEVLFALAVRYPSLWECELLQLHADQVAWHREWMRTYEGRRLAQGMAAVDPREHLWPVAPAELSHAA
jgi:DNA polymerase III subunit epsilon